jgi:hypothetical protein
VEIAWEIVDLVDTILIVSGSVVGLLAVIALLLALIELLSGPRTRVKD